MTPRGSMSASSQDRTAAPLSVVDRLLLSALILVVAATPVVALAAFRDMGDGVRHERAAMYAVGGTGEAFTSIAWMLARLPMLTVAVTALTVAALVVRTARRGALSALALLAIANVGAQALKTALGHLLPPAADTLPSGHAVLALSSACALVLIAPSRWRTASLVVGGALATLGCAGVVAAYWHTPGDVIAALTFVGGLVAISRLWTSGEAGSNAVSWNVMPWSDVWWSLAGAAWTVVTFLGWGTVLNSFHGVRLAEGVATLVSWPCAAAVVVACAARPAVRR